MFPSKTENSPHDPWDIRAVTPASRFFLDPCDCVRTWHASWWIACCDPFIPKKHGFFPVRDVYIVLFLPETHRHDLVAKSWCWSDFPDVSSTWTDGCFQHHFLSFGWREVHFFLGGPPTHRNVSKNYSRMWVWWWRPIICSLWTMLFQFSNCLASFWGLLCSKGFGRLAWYFPDIPRLGLPPSKGTIGLTFEEKHIGQQSKVTLAMNQNDFTMTRYGSAKL